jgi:hypothetical protein
VGATEVATNGAAIFPRQHTVGDRLTTPRLAFILSTARRRGSAIPSSPSIMFRPVIVVVDIDGMRSA